MTDKVQKIREKVERLKSNLIQGACASQIAMETRCKEEAYNEVLAILDTMQEEPVNDDLEEEIDNYVKRNGYDGLDSIEEVKYIANHFAKWQKEQFEKNRLAACKKQTKEEAEIEADFFMGIIENEHRQPTFDDAIKYGMKKMKEQMMANTADAMIGLPYENKDGGYTHIIDVSRPLPVGDNKIAIIFKEE